uniref:NADH dehydrogenase subunit 6 n=1 Tax=Tuberolachnus salignus TaxID=96551 RepID=UPI001EDF90A2|nr:NADH dehydrogenase subunit 6 [Tuberolachnus salignus]UGY86209.1 NADH dehydrogenase subunit 6 [Tuberolachnus salignus]
MMIKMIMMTNLMMSIMLISMKSPLSSNLIILIQTITLSILTNLINKTSWISFMIFILYVSGLMIIFLYISSIAFNELNINKNFKLIIIKMMIIMMILMNMKKYIIMENFNFQNNYLFEDNIYIINMFNMPNNLMIYFILLILFFMLILVIWLMKNNKGPLRQKF